MTAGGEGLEVEEEEEEEEEVGAGAWGRVGLEGAVAPIGGAAAAAGAAAATGADGIAMLTERDGGPSSDKETEDMKEGRKASPAGGAGEAWKKGGGGGGGEAAAAATASSAASCSCSCLLLWGGMGGRLMPDMLDAPRDLEAAEEEEEALRISRRR
jgi:hypothetical protein